MKIDIDKIYICHWNKLSDRKKNLKQQLLEHQIHDYEWVELYDKDNWNKDQIVKEYPRVFGLNPITMIGDEKYGGRYLREAEISLLLKHCWIIKSAFDIGYESILIFEDDIMLDKDFIYKFNEFKAQLPDDWDMCWIGSCCGLHAQYIKDVHVYRTYSSRCTHAYMISKKGINKIINDISNINEAIDWYYNILIKKLNLENYWFEPSLVSQGQYGTTVQN